METSAHRRLTAIVMADLVGYSRLMGVDETGTLSKLRAHRSELIDPLVSRHGGRVVKSLGDGLLLEFYSVVDAVKCCLDVQKGMLQRNKGLPDDKVMQFRIGVHLGDILVEEDDIFGDGVNIAARIEALANPGGIAISEDVYRQVRDRLDVTWFDGGEHQVKNIKNAISVRQWTATGLSEVPIIPAFTEPRSEESSASVAVLPFDNMSGDTEQTYFADGITEDIITELSRIPELTVISRNSTFTYKGKAVKTQDVCQDLGVRCVLEGSVRKSGDKVRITAQLIDGKTGGHLWAERYDRGLADIFAVQDDVTEKIVNALTVNLVSVQNDRPGQMETKVTEAYDYVLRGREKYRLYSREGNVEARNLFEKAIEHDPGYAAAYAGLAETYLHDWFSGEKNALNRAHELVFKANELNPSLSIVYEALSSVHLFKKQHHQAIVAARRWIEFEPGNADAYANLAAMLHFSGENEPVFSLIEKAIFLNPFYPFYYNLYKGQAQLALERYEEALHTIERCVEHNPESMSSQLYLAACYGLLDNDVSSRQALDKVREITPDLTMGWVRTFIPYKNEADLDRLIEGLRKAGFTD